MPALRKLKFDSCHRSLISIFKDTILQIESHSLMEKEYKTHNVSSFREFQDIILDIPTDHFILYRGQTFDKTLLPKIARYNKEDIDEVEREMLEDFQRRSIHLIEYHPGNAWD